MYRLLDFDYELNKKAFHVDLLIDEKNAPVDLTIESYDDPSLVGDIYVAKVNRYLPSLNACFADIDQEKSLFIPLAETDDVLYVKKLSNQPHPCQGDEILVEIKKDKTDIKDPTASTNLCLYSKHFILTSGDKKIGISKKITTGREQLKELLEEYTKDHNFGIIVRSNIVDVLNQFLIEGRKAEEALSARKMIDTELLSLKEEFQKLIERYPYFHYPTQVRKRNTALYDMLHAAGMDQISEVICDSDINRDRLTASDDFFELKDRIRIYDDSYPLIKLYQIETLFDRLLHKKVSLKSGGNIYIEPTEALTVIDVNSAKEVGKKSSALTVNLEAANQCYQQIRLRNISGIIMIDFINMKSKEEQQQLLNYLNQLFSQDYRKTKAFGYTKLGLIEISREKKNRSLKEILTI